jgi:hypothetical protein
MNFQILTSYNVYIRFPETLPTGLTKVGGLIAIFKIGYLLSLLHKRRYYSEVRRISGSSDYGTTRPEDKFTLETFQQLIDQSHINKREIATNTQTIEGLRLQLQSAD